MKANVTSSSGIRLGHQAKEMSFSTLEELRDFILSTGHACIISVPQIATFNESGRIAETKTIFDALDIEIYDGNRE